MRGNCNFASGMHASVIFVDFFPGHLTHPSVLFQMILVPPNVVGLPSENKVYMAHTADKCPKDPLKIKKGKCGCGVSAVDTDGDGYPDCHGITPPMRTSMTTTCVLYDIASHQRSAMRTLMRETLDSVAME